jgi:hypothetical protein
LRTLLTSFLFLQGIRQPFQLWHVVKVSAAGFGISRAVSSRSHSTAQLWFETTINDRRSSAIPAL